MRHVDRSRKALKQAMARAAAEFVLTLDTLDEWRAHRRATKSRSVHETWRCAGVGCGRFTQNGAYRTGICNWCGTPRP